PAAPTLQPRATPPPYPTYPTHATHPTYPPYPTYPTHPSYPTYPTHPTHPTYSTYSQSWSNALALSLSTGEPSVRDFLRGGTVEGLRSNNWVVDGTLTACVQATLANAPPPRAPP